MLEYEYFACSISQHRRMDFHQFCRSPACLVGQERYFIINADCNPVMPLSASSSLQEAASIWPTSSVVQLHHVL